MNNSLERIHLKNKEKTNEKIYNSGAGFIGSHIAEYLSGEGLDIWICK